MRGLLALLFGRRRHCCKLRYNAEDTVPTVQCPISNRLTDSGEMVKRALEEMRLAQIALSAFEMPPLSKRNGGAKVSRV